VKGVLAALLLTASVVLSPGTAQAQGADAQGWWTQVNGAVPPDVGATDLLLQGGDPARVLPNTGGAVDQAPQPTALAAVRFSVTPGAQVGALVLQLAPGGQAMDVRAYPAKQAWVAVQGGALADAAIPDLTRYSAGKLSADGASLVFPDVGRLATEQGLLSVVLVPGALDRVVLHAPLPTALTVSPPAAVPTDEAPPVAPPAADPVVAPLDLQPGAAPAPVLPRVDATAPTLADLPAPALAPQALPVAVAPAVAAASTARSLVPDDGRTRWFVLLELALVAAFFGLLGQGPLARLGGLTGQRAAAETARGVGRFRIDRTGSAPRL
jgi:hypothetical protein